MNQPMREMLGSVSERAQGPVMLLLPGLQGGGAERVLVHYANWLVKHGQATTLVLCERVGEYFDEVDSRVEIVSLGCRNEISACWAFYRLVRQRRPAAVLTTLPQTILIASLVHRISPHRFRLVLRQASVFSLNMSRRKGLNWLILPLEISFYRNADAIIAISSGVAKDLAAEVGIPLSRIQVIHNPVDVDAVLLLSQNESKLPVSVGLRDPYIVAVSRLSRQKDHATLLRAFARVRKAKPCQLAIMGSGPLREDLGRLAQELGIDADVFFFGFVSNPFPIIRRASVFVSSSRWEAFGNSLLQAMACGTPVVATDCPHGPREIMADGKYGRLTPVSDAAALAAAILDTMASPRNSALLMEAARRYDPDRQYSLYSAALNPAGFMPVESS